MIMASIYNPNRHFYPYVFSIKPKILITKANKNVRIYIISKGCTQGKMLYYSERDIEEGLNFTGRKMFL